MGRSIHSASLFPHKIEVPILLGFTSFICVRGGEPILRSSRKAAVTPKLNRRVGFSPAGLAMTALKITLAQLQYKKGGREHEAHGPS
jgi:hypothetical protein